MAEKDMRDESLENGDLNINTDENQSGTTHLNDPLQEGSELDRLQAELDDAKDKHLRAVAELDNIRRRTAKERIELIQTAGKEVIVDLLGVLDDMDRAQKQMETSNDADAIKEGVMLVFNKLRTTLYNRGLKPMDARNTEFNPDLHEAITEVAVPSEELKGKVVDEITKGYYLNDKIIRHAKVVVGK